MAVFRLFNVRCATSSFPFSSLGSMTTGETVYAGKVSSRNSCHKKLGGVLSKVKTTKLTIGAVSRAKLS